MTYFDRYFDVLPVRDAAARDAVYRLRYQVYCEELGYEDPQAFPDGRERDEFDAGSHYALLRHRGSERHVGCVRLILHRDEPQRPLPFETVCAGRIDRERLDLPRLDRTRCGEISRLAVHHDFRRRVGEWQSPDGGNGPDAQRSGQRRWPLLPMSLFLSASALGLNMGLEQVFVMMEPRLARLLANCGIRFTPVGEVIDYHGQRGPFRITREELLGGLSSEAHAMLDELRGRLHPA